MSSCGADLFGAVNLLRTGRGGGTDYSADGKTIKLDPTSIEKRKRYPLSFTSFSSPSMQFRMHLSLMFSALSIAGALAQRPPMYRHH